MNKYKATFENDLLISIEKVESLPNEPKGNKYSSGGNNFSGWVCVYDGNEDDAKKQAKKEFKEMQPQVVPSAI